MMAAMMLPAVAPMVAAHRRRAVGRGATPAFAAGYLLAWLGAGLVAFALIGGVRSLGPGFLAWDEAGRYVAGAVIFGGALYQLTGAEDACLRRCGDPQAFLTEHCRPGCSASSTSSQWPLATQLDSAAAITRSMIVARAAFFTSLSASNGTSSGTLTSTTAFTHRCMF